MWISRLREALLLGFIWLMAAGLAVGLVAAVCGVFLWIWPQPSPFFLGALAILLAWGLIRLVQSDLVGRIRKAITPKYYAKILEAEAAEAKDPWQRPPPSRWRPPHLQA